MPDTLFESDLSSLDLVMRGKVRDVYAIGDDHLLIVTTDRLSAFDVILSDPIPGKGVVLTALSNFWFDYFTNDIANHRADIPLNDILTAAEIDQVGTRSMVVRRLEALPVEAVARGYIIGSGWKDYQATGRVSGIELPAGLAQADALDDPIFTPSTKAAAGEHDEAIDFDRVIELVGESRAIQIRHATLSIYKRAAAYARERGIIIADTKFEFGIDSAGELVLIDEALTPDSSRFWPADEYATGMSPPSFDKQYVRDYLETLDWDKTAPAPRLPQPIIDNTAAKYREAAERLTGG
ncbi:phosphoribosylaminoimidazolesuccinocarboxamide synthase [Salinisphaera sp. T31B1]|uniref:phosphoribosylaminoimidazolesuccinocarboxamide synthase n=1 Tax=Salinisphaera sp. T31B1 TaxID=727963 RepID=UPI0033421685